MKYILALIMLAALPVLAQQTVTLTVTLSSDHVWALTQDWEDYRAADTTNNTLTKLQWFQSNATNQILRAADRRVAIRGQERLAIIARRWDTLTPEQKTNVLNALPQ